MARDGFAARVRQLRANCESPERLRTMIDNVSGRGSAIVEEVVAQHGFVCPELVRAVVLPEGGKPR